jgi:hypothetical protein
MSQIDPPVEFANPKNKEKMDYLLEHATRPDFDYPQVSRLPLLRK